MRAWKPEDGGREMDTGEAGAISFPCARCEARLTAAAGKAGKRGRCRHCGMIQIIPGGASEYVLAESPPASPVVARAPVIALEPVRRTWRGSSAWGVVSSWIHASARERSALEGESVALILLSLADLMVTYHLLRSGPGFYESNPIAQFFFARWNIAGMAVFKFSVVGFVVVVGEIVERNRPGLGRFVVLVGCIASGVVVCYGLKLAMGAFAD
jgi:hypothetical protein